MLLSKNSPCIWATFDRNHVTENFQKSLNLVTLVGPLEEEFLSNQRREMTPLPKNSWNQFLVVACQQHKNIKNIKTKKHKNKKTGLWRRNHRKWWRNCTWLFRRTSMSKVQKREFRLCLLSCCPGFESPALFQNLIIAKFVLIKKIKYEHKRQWLAKN